MTPLNQHEFPLQARVGDFFARGGILAQACAAAAIPFEIRPQQQKMAEAVAAALLDQTHLAVEAGTGVGKTFAYLVPLLLWALPRQQRVAVSTYTINLQEQLMFKDVPFLLKNMGLDFKVALCKGRHNYVCLRRLESAYQLSGDLFNKNREKELIRIRHWADAGGLAHRSPEREAPRDAGGSLADFSDVAQPAPAVWQQVCSEPDNCLARRCRHYARCFLMKARNAAFNADLLILNHHLFFSDLALRRSGGGILPDFEAIVLDEAHTLEDIAGEHLGLRVSQGGIYRWLRRLYAPATGKGLLAALREPALAEETGRVWESVERFFAEISALVISAPAAPERTALAVGKHVFKTRLEIKSMLPEQLARLARGLEKIREQTEKEELRAELNAIGRRGEEIRAALDFFLKQPDPNQVYWVEQEGGRPPAGHGRLALVSAPVEVAPLLSDILFPAFAPVVMTSATLSVNKSLEFFRQRIGAGNCRELALDSPFNYQRQMRVLLAADLPEPNHEKFPEAAAKAVAHFVAQTNGRAFVLFTNAALMRRVAAGLRDFFEKQGFLLLMQGAGLPRHAMLKKFKMAHDNCRASACQGPSDSEKERRAASSGPTLPEQDPTAPEKSPATGWSASGGKIEKAVLFGLDSFWFGVDVPGAALANVIIVRLPFAVPDEPLVKARIDRIAAQGRDAFREYSLPQAILKFRQGVGRLIRTAGDEGLVVILDSRIFTRWYGKYFLQSIPECPREQVRLELTCMAGVNLPN